MCTGGKQHFEIHRDENGHPFVNFEDADNSGDQDIKNWEIKVLSATIRQPLKH